jgi:hypothetical protein
LTFPGKFWRTFRMGRKSQNITNNIVMSLLQNSGFKRI